MKSENLENHQNGVIPAVFFFFTVNLYLKHNMSVFHKMESMYYRAKFYQKAEKLRFEV